MNSEVTVERDLPTVSATMAPSMLRGPRWPVTTTSSISTAAVPVDWAVAAPAMRTPLIRAVVAQNSCLRLVICLYPQ
ncbi:hypothetical protein D3C81_1849260 [compost metagenome]